MYFIIAEKPSVAQSIAAALGVKERKQGYLQGKSELALKDCLTSHCPRDRYVLTDKLTANFFKTEADIRPFF